MNDTPAAEFRTEDLQLAAFLSALGISPRIEGPQDRRQFIFEPKASQRVAEYYQVPCPCSAKDLFRQYRGLRARMFRGPAVLH